MTTKCYLKSPNIISYLCDVINNIMVKLNYYNPVCGRPNNSIFYHVMELLSLENDKSSTDGKDAVLYSVVFVKYDLFTTYL